MPAVVFENYRMEWEGLREKPDVSKEKSLVS